MSKSTSYKFKMEQNKITELLNRSFPDICQKNEPTNKQKPNKCGFPEFFRIVNKRITFLLGALMFTGSWLMTMAWSLSGEAMACPGLMGRGVRSPGPVPTVTAKPKKANTRRHRAESTNLRTPRIIVCACALRLACPQLFSVCLVFPSNVADAIWRFRRRLDRALSLASGDHHVLTVFPLTYFLSNI